MHAKATAYAVALQHAELMSLRIRRLRITTPSHSHIPFLTDLTHPASQPNY